MSSMMDEVWNAGPATGLERVKPEERRSATNMDPVSLARW